MNTFDSNVVKVLLVLLSWQAKLVTSSCNFPDAISFLSYFPCTHVDNLTSVEECDIFAYTAARLAVKRLEQSSNILSFTEDLVAIPTGKARLPSYAIPSSHDQPEYSCVRLRFSSLQEGDLDVEEVMFQSAEHLVDPNTLGIVGPAHPELATRVVPLASDKLGILQVSYSSTGIEVGSGSTFYRDLPSDLFVNEARLSLLIDFQWYKVSLLYAQEVSYAKTAEILYRTFDQETHAGHQNIEIAFFGTFHAPESAEPALQEMARMRLRIIIGLFGPSDARRVLCRAHGHGLTTSEHVWILPSYYNPNWWKLADTERAGLPEAERCSNDEMILILNSALFVDPVKFPLLQPDSMALTPMEFHRQLIVITKELFPSLSDTDLTTFLLHSRATRAYEAVWLMALAWDDVLSNNGSCAVQELQNSIEKMMFCEWCNVYSPCFNNETLRKDCDFCGDYNVTVAERDKIVDYYGQILVSQFIDGTDCPIGFYWPDSLENSFRTFEFVRFTDLESGSHCFHELHLDASMLNHTSGCPPDFWWKGRTSPPSGEFSPTYSDIGVPGLVILCVLIAFELVYAIALLTASIVWRKNKHIKASSPRLNIVIIVALILHLPYLLMDAIVISSNRLTIPSTADLLCQLLPWGFFFPPILLFGTLLVKNWRIYCIFHNKQLKRDLSWWLSDKALLILIILLATPDIAVLLLWSVIDPPKIDMIIDGNNIVTTCDTKYLETWIAIIVLYFVIILVILLFIGYLNSEAQSRFSEKEGEASQKVLMLTMVFAVVAIVSLLYIWEELTLYLVTFWLLTLSSCLFESVILAILYIPQFIQIYKDHIQSAKVVTRKKESERYQKDYEAAREEIQGLRMQLKEMERKKQMLTSRSFN